MAGRMAAGRGRGRSNQSFSMEKELGIPKGDTVLSKPVLQPSLKFPPLDCKPPPIHLNAEMSYLVELKRDFTEYMRESPNNVQAVVVNEDIERFCDDYEETIAEYYASRSEYESRYDWNKMPAQLKSSHKKRKSSQKNAKEQRKRIKVVDVDYINNKLKEMEETENMQEIKAEEEDEAQNDEDNDEDKDMDEHGDKEDAEMDEGTDYMKEYIDNEDLYYSEDENDDGPTF